jgi:hypothetical protein
MTSAQGGDNQSARLSAVMFDVARHPYRILWIGFAFALGAMLCNAVFFLSPPGQRFIPWLSLLLAVAALVFLASGLRAVLRQAPTLRGKILSSILTLAALLLVGVTIFAFVTARALPSAAGTPKIGDKAPDFALADTSGRPISLDQLFAPPAANPQSAPPKAVLLIFYRGYW